MRRYISMTFLFVYLENPATYVFTLESQREVTYGSDIC